MTVQFRSGAFICTDGRQAVCHSAWDRDFEGSTPSRPILLLCGVMGNMTDSGSVVLGPNPSRGIKHRLFLLNGNYWFDSSISPPLAKLLQPALIWAVRISA